MATNKDFKVKTGLTTGGNVTINGIATATGVIQSTTGNTNQTYLQAVNTGAQVLLGVESNVAGTLATGSSAYAGIVGTFSNTPLHITSNGIVRITVDTVGNAGLGTLPSAWGGAKAFDIGTTVAVFQNTGNGGACISNNLYFNGTNWTYKTTGTASMYQAVTGTHFWYSSISGTGGTTAALTNNMTLDQSGHLNLLTGNLYVGTSAVGSKMISSGSGSASLLIGINGVEKARIDAATGAILSRVTSAYSGFNFQTNNMNGYAIQNVAGTGIGAYFGAGAQIGLSSAGPHAVINSSTGNIIFGTNNALGATLSPTGLAVVGNIGATGDLTITGTARITANTASSWATEINQTGTVNAHGLYVNIAAAADAQCVPFRVDKAGSALFTVTQTSITDSGGNELGFKNIPVVGNGWQRGKCNVVTTGTSVNTSAAGDTYSIFNNSTVAITLTQTAGLTLYLGGTNSTGNRTILPHGFATIWYMDATTAVINGNVT